ncbi:MAG: hypothetical protein KGO82_16150 [Bacteroidota bacterium]|nr:hypothetical protein [Bacteroidota bacterium]
MNVKEKLPVWVVSSLLLVNCFLVFYTDWLHVIYFISAIGPFLIVWMVYSVLKYGKYKAADLQEEEEWGYADRTKDEAGRL